ncbi:hypothetical protein V8F33_012767, partial [Rhypophila sp. PSN 637]
WRLKPIFPSSTLSKISFPYPVCQTTAHPFLLHSHNRLRRFALVVVSVDAGGVENLSGREGVTRPRVTQGLGIDSGRGTTMNPASDPLFTLSPPLAFETVVASGIPSSGALTSTAAAASPFSEDTTGTGCRPSSASILLCTPQLRLLKLHEPLVLLVKPLLLGLLHPPHSLRRNELNLPLFLGLLGLLGLAPVGIAQIVSEKGPVRIDSPRATQKAGKPMGQSRARTNTELKASQSSLKSR